MAAAAPTATPDDAGELKAARLQARRRLIGSVVLLAIGVVAFPLLFETKPRPMPINIPIDASRVDGNSARVASGYVAPQRTLAAVPAQVGNESPGNAASAVALAPPAAGPVVAPTPGQAPAPATATLSAPTAVAPLASAPAARVVAPTPLPSEAKPLVVAAKPPAAAPTAVKATPTEAVSPAAAASADAAAPRYIVQVGAFNDTARMREARAKVERIGYATYISDVDSPTGRRTRVRLGPFPNRDQAEAAAVKVKASGLPANILKL